MTCTGCPRFLGSACIGGRTDNKIASQFRIRNGGSRVRWNGNGVDHHDGLRRGGLGQISDGHRSERRSLRRRCFGRDRQQPLRSKRERRIPHSGFIHRHFLMACRRRSKFRPRCVRYRSGRGQNYHALQAHGKFHLRRRHQIRTTYGLDTIYRIGKNRDDLLGRDVVRFLRWRIGGRVNRARTTPASATC